ncbi:MAG: aconitase X catalytic domain-containing protein [Holophaga sp.]|jgi:hypothetical protein
MILTQEQKAMLDGKHGPGTGIAMKIQIKIGESFNAKRLVPITRAHVALSAQEADVWFAEKLSNAGAKCRVPTTVNPGFCLSYFKERNMVSESEAYLMTQTHSAYKNLGAILSYNCTPYHGTNIPRFGEITAFSESSATPYINSVYGARSNREGANSALCAAVTGFVPEYGLLLDENRKGEILVDVKADIKSDFDYQLLGYMGKKIGNGIPVFVGLPKDISPEALMNLGAQLNTSGAYGMYHIVGVTPEAPSLEAAFGGRKPDRKVVIKAHDLEQILNEISEPGGRAIDFAMFGCPHLSLRQVQEIANIVQGKQVKAEIWILTSSHTKEMAIRMGIADVIENAGGHIVEDTCCDQPCWSHLKGKYGVTDSPKCAYYPKRRGINFIIRSLEECVESALNGRVD